MGAPGFFNPGARLVNPLTNKPYSLSVRSGNSHAPGAGAGSRGKGSGLPTYLKGYSGTYGAQLNPLLAGELGLTAAETAAQLALGSVPITAPFAFGLELAELFGFDPFSVFAGKPKLLDTVQAIQRLSQSRDPEIQQLTRNLAILARNGAPLSSGKQQIQAQIRDWIGGAVRTILERTGQTQNAQAVAALDQAIRAVLTSETARPGSSVDQVIAQLGAAAVTPAISGGAGISARAPASPISAPRGQRNPFPSLAGGFSPGFSISHPGQLPAPSPISPPAGDQGLIAQLAQLAQSHPYLNLAGCIALVVAATQGAPGAATAAEVCLGELLKNQIELEARNIIQGARDYVSRLLGRQPSGAPTITPASQYVHTPDNPAPMLDQSYCKECDPKARALERQTQQQLSRLRKDIRTEQEQGIEQQLAQQEQQLTHFEELEEQPASSRDIKQELEQKQQLKQQLEQQSAQLRGQNGDQGQSGQYPELAPGQQLAPKLQESSSAQAEQQIERDLHSHEESQPLTFCVGCKSNEDAILFLNGEPSECSVIPGSTKPLQL